MCQNHAKRRLDAARSSVALVVLSTVLATDGVLVRVNLGEPAIFRQLQPGLNKEPFGMYKFRTTTDERDESGILPPDEGRLRRFGRALRSMSHDGLPEPVNTRRGDMSIVRPRPLLVKYLPLYSELQRQRHPSRPNRTAFAQATSKNSLSWEETFAAGVQNADNVNLAPDRPPRAKTGLRVICREDTSEEHHAPMNEVTGAAESN